ncbi:MAG: TspO protein [Moorea sp. SIO2B7]|nr:TspO protein [Moorena sp. SIO2B7]
MIPSWLIIACVALLMAWIINRLSPADISWFNRLRRPNWLTFEWAIPFIWIFIFICGGWSSYVVWELNPGSRESWLLMGFYLLVEVTILAYTPVMCKLRSLTVGTIIGGTGFVFGLILGLIVIQFSTIAFVLLLPYLLWSPIGTYVTWEMIKLNPGNA